MDHINAHERELTVYAMQQLKRIPDMRIFGEAENKDAVISFLVGNIHHLDMGTLLDRLGIAVRTGHHCAQPLMQRLGIEGTVRASFALYNTKEEVDALVAGIERDVKCFKLRLEKFRGYFSFPSSHKEGNRYLSMQRIKRIHRIIVINAMTGVATKSYKAIFIFLKPIFESCPSK